MQLHVPELSIPIQSYTPSPCIERIGTFCRPLLDEIYSQYPSIKWAGIFKGSSLYKGIKIFIGFSPDATRDYAGRSRNLDWLRDRLQEVPDVSVKVIGGVQHEIVDLEGINVLLSAKTIWGDVSWLDVNRGIVSDKLRHDYARIKAAEDLLFHAHHTLLSIEVRVI
jgi:hypothetical protein